MSCYDEFVVEGEAHGTTLFLQSEIQKAVAERGGKHGHEGNVDTWQATMSRPSEEANLLTPDCFVARHVSPQLVQTLSKGAASRFPEYFLSMYIFFVLLQYFSYNGIRWCLPMKMQANPATSLKLLDGLTLGVLLLGLIVYIMLGAWESVESVQFACRLSGAMYAAHYMVDLLCRSLQDMKFGLVGHHVMVQVFLCFYTDFSSPSRLNLLHGMTSLVSHLPMCFLLVLRECWKSERGLRVLQKLTIVVFTVSTTCAVVLQAALVEESACQSHVTSVAFFLTTFVVWDYWDVYLLWWIWNFSPERAVKSQGAPSEVPQVTPSEVPLRCHGPTQPGQ